MFTREMITPQRSPYPINTCRMYRSPPVLLLKQRIQWWQRCSPRAPGSPRAPAAAKMLQTTTGTISHPGGPHLPLHHGTSSGSVRSLLMDRNWLGVSGWKIALWKSISFLRNFVGSDHIIVNFSNGTILENLYGPHILASYFIYR